MADILFGQSYYLRFDPKLYAAMQPYPPLGALYAASYLRARGWDVALFDAMLAESEQEWAAVLDRYTPRYAVLFEDNFNYLSKMCLLRMRAAAFTMIDMAKTRSCTVILCGADVTDHSPKYFEHGADFALLGEGEETLGELLDRLSGRTDTPLENILGLAYPISDVGFGNADSAIRNPQSAIRINPRRPDITQLDELPFPAWDLVDIPRYRKVWRERHGYYSMNMVTTRGCPYHCNWCAKPIWGQRYNSRSPENVAAEMKWLKETYRPDHIWFADDIFGLKPGWIERFGKLVKAQDAAIPFKCLSRADLIKPSVVEGLKAAGCQIVWMGAESGSQKILDAMDKGTNVPQIYEARRLLGDAGIRVAFFLQFGYPGETRRDVERTLQLVRETMPDDIGISVSYPLPGTKFYERVKSQLGQKQNWVDSDDLAMLYQGPFPQPFYRMLHRVVHGEFRMRRAGLALKRDLLRPLRWRMRHLRLLASLPYHWLSWKINRLRLNRIERSAASPASALESR
ncbi:MAG TPA: radical SAM protein [Anaerolineae bacterium]|nr:radical SAM protein [Anaerolineae bacterium]